MNYLYEGEIQARTWQDKLYSPDASEDTLL